MQATITIYIKSAHVKLNYVWTSVLRLSDIPKYIILAQPLFSAWMRRAIERPWEKNASTDWDLPICALAAPGSLLS